MTNIKNSFEKSMFLSILVAAFTFSTIYSVLDYNNNNIVDEILEDIPVTGVLGVSDFQYNWVRVSEGKTPTTMSDTYSSRTTDFGVSPLNESSYQLGFFMGTNVDFDDSAGTDLKSSASNNTNIFVTKRDKEGNYIWTRIINSATRIYENPNIPSIEFLDDGSYIILGSTYGGDIDLSSGVDNPGNCSFISKYDANDNLIWSAKYTNGVTPTTLKVKGNRVYVTGAMQGTVDLNPGTASDNYTATAGYFLSVFDISGNYIKSTIFANRISPSGAIIWVYNNTVDVDNSDRIHIAGVFRATWDFDPGTGTNSKTSVGVESGFISIFDKDLNYIGTKTIDTTTSSGGSTGITTLQFSKENDMYISGFNYGPVNFNLSGIGGADTKSHLTQNGPGSFVSKYNSDGSYAWTRRSGLAQPGVSNGSIQIIGASSTQGILQITESDTNTINFNDSGSGSADNIGSPKYTVITKYKSDGSYDFSIKFQTRLNAAISSQKTLSTYIDKNGYLYLSGNETAGDFDPGVATVTKTYSSLKEVFYLAKYKFTNALSSTTSSTRNCGGFYDNPLYINGGLYTNEITLGRCSNGDNPSHLFKYNAKYIELFRNELTKREFSIREN